MSVKYVKAWLPALIWMGVIYLMSAASGEVSGEQSGRLVSILSAVYGFFTGGAQIPPDALALLHTLLRKAAHMTEYAVLSLLYLRALSKSGARRPALWALMLCVLYAATDEIHQAFVPDRGPSPVDVMIDACGAAAALALHRLARRLRA